MDPTEAMAFGRLQERMDNIEEKLEKLEKILTMLQGDFQVARGGLRMLVAVASVAAAAGAFASHLLAWFRGPP